MAEPETPEPVADRAGAAKRAGPVAAGVALLWLLGVFLRRRRRS